MNILYQGIEKRTDDVTLMISKDKDVELAQAQYDECIKKMKEKFGADDDLFYQLDEAVNNLSYWETFSTYKIALSDGMELQQEIKALAIPRIEDGKE